MMLAKIFAILDMISAAMTSSLATNSPQENVPSSGKFQLLGELQFILILSSLLGYMLFLDLHLFLFPKLCFF